MDSMARYSLGSIQLDHHDHLQDGALNRLVNLYQGRGGCPKLEGASLNGCGDGQPMPVPVALFTFVCPHQKQRGLWTRRT